ncbi:MAG: hypothetical protein AABX88_01050 [Nanoarchaeota archaeon]
MIKKRKVAKRKSNVKNVSHVTESSNHILNQNLITLQKIMVNFSSNFEHLSKQISRLVELFELSARSIAEKDFRDSKRIEEKLNVLIDQDKILAKGLTLLHEVHNPPQEIAHIPIIKNLPQRQTPASPQNMGPGTYEKSVSNEFPPLPKQGERYQTQQNIGNEENSPTR